MTIKEIVIVIIASGVVSLVVNIVLGFGLGLYDGDKDDE